MTILVKISDIDLQAKTVLIREDYNVPLRNGKISDDSRIRASLPTVHQVLDAGAKIILVSHLGRPTEGEYNEAYSLAPVAESLSKLLGMNVPLVRDWINGIDMSDSSIVLCENVRFEKGEIKNDEDLARKMAQLCQIYINDAFATSHRAQASTYGIAKYTSISAAGPLLINELKSLSKAFYKPEKPVTAIVGGSKVSTKLTVLETLSSKVDQLILGGGIANTFLKAAGYNIGASLYEPDLVDVAYKLMDSAKKANCHIPLPIDVVCGKSFDENTLAKTKLIDEVAEDDLIMDIGPKTSEQFNKNINKSNTIIWNGPLGVFEFEAFSKGTEDLASVIAKSNAYSIVGGGDTISAVNKFGIEKDVSYISTGGGAFLEFLEGKKLPAIAILEEATRAWEAMEKAREL